MKIYIITITELGEAPEVFAGQDYETAMVKARKWLVDFWSDNYVGYVTDETVEVIENIRKSKNVKELLRAVRGFLISQHIQEI